MKNLSRHKGVLGPLERLPSSIHGNPRYSGKVGGFTFVTRPDSSLAYSLPNIVGMECEVLLGTHYGVTTLASVRVT